MAQNKPMFTKATKKKAKARLALIGVAGSGKTYSSLLIARGLGKRIAVIDSEHGSASKYADLVDFDALELESFHPERYIEAIRAAEDGGYDVIIIDSLSHAWMGKDGALELVDRAKASSHGSSFNAWGSVTPIQNELVDAMLACKCHLIVTMRSKTAYEVVRDPQTGKTTVTKIGLEPVQRGGLEYEFDVVGDIDLNSVYTITKTRCSALHQKTIRKPGVDLAKTLMEWLTAGVDAPTPEDTAKRSALIQELRAMSEQLGERYRAAIGDVKPTTIPELEAAVERCHAALKMPSAAAPDAAEEAAHKRQVEREARAEILPPKPATPTPVPTPAPQSAAPTVSRDRAAVDELAAKVRELADGAADADALLTAAGYPPLAGATTAQLFALRAELNVTIGRLGAGGPSLEGKDVDPDTGEVFAEVKVPAVFGAVRDVGWTKADMRREFGNDDPTGWSQAMRREAMERIALVAKQPASGERRAPGAPAAAMRRSEPRDHRRDEEAERRADAEQAAAERMAKILGV